MDNSQQRFPSIAIDLDGVVWYSGRLIDGSKEALHLLTKDLNKVDQDKYGQLNDGVQIPFLFLTNSGARTENITAQIMNQKLDLPEGQIITGEHMILNFTPLRQEMKKFTNKIVLVSGFENTAEILEDCGIKYYITMVEYAKLYPNLVPNNFFNKEDQNETKKILKARLLIQDDTMFDKFIQVHAIFLSYISNNIEIVTQVLCDVLSTFDGNIAHQFPNEGPDTHIPVYSVANDYFFPPREFHLIRLGFGMYLDAICDIYKKTYKKELQVQRCGKPSKMTFQFCLDKSNEFALKNNMQISSFYMIGDNPHTDIRGAKQLGWETILVRTGVYQGQQINDPEEVPDKIVNDFREAIKYIYEKEGISCNL